MDIPSKFICPITMEIMVHPMATRTGCNYERSAIIAWISEGAGLCPLTRQPLTLSSVISNHALATEIERWCRKHNIHRPVATTDVDDNGGDNAAKAWSRYDTLYPDVHQQMYGTTKSVLDAATDEEDEDEEQEDDDTSLLSATVSSPLRTKRNLSRVALLFKSTGTSHRNQPCRPARSRQPFLRSCRLG